MDIFLYLATFSGVIAMLFAFWKTSWINSQDEGTDRMKSIGSSIADGAMAFLRAEYRILAIFVVAVAILVPLPALLLLLPLLLRFLLLLCRKSCNY